MLFFCSCKYPGYEDRDGCHRTAVARLVLETAARRNLSAQVVEWPGGEPGEPRVIAVSPAALRRLNGGAKSIPLDEPVSLGDVAGTPWYSTVEIHERGATAVRHRMLTGPARYDHKAGWSLPRLADVDLSLAPPFVRRQAQELRTQGGFDPRRTRS